MIHYIINYITKWLYGDPYQTVAKKETFEFIPSAKPIKSIEHLNQIKNFEFKKNRQYYFKY
jgi:hypothetical protein